MTPLPKAERNLPPVVEDGGPHSNDSLVRGGPFYRAQVAARLIGPNQWNVGRRLIFAICLGWLPLVLLTLSFNPQAVFSLLRSYPVNAQLLIAVPVLLAGQLVMETTFRGIIGHVREAGLLSPKASAQMDTIIATLLRSRDSAIPEIVIILLIFLQEVVIFKSRVSVAQPWAVFGAGAQVHPSAAGWYYVLLSRPLYQFLLGVSLWKWLLWCYFLFRLSRLDLQLLATHPDQRGGLGFLGLSPIANAPIVLAACFVIGSNWRFQILRQGMHLTDFKLEAAALLAVVAIIAMGPLIVFVPRLVKVRRRGILEYGTLSQLHSSDFHAKWITHRAGHEQEFLAAPEVSTLTDLASSFDNIEKMQALPYDKGALVTLALAFAIPMIPVVLAEVPLVVVLKALLQAVK